MTQDLKLFTLEECIKAERDLWAFCRACGHAVRADTKSIVLKAGFVSLGQAEKRMRCRRCTKRGMCLLIPNEKWPTR